MPPLTSTSACLALVLALGSSHARAQFDLPQVKIPLPPGVDGRPLPERIGNGRQGIQLLPHPTESLSTNFPIDSRAISVTFTNRAPYGVDFVLNGGGSVNPVRARLEPGTRNTFRMPVASGVTPVVQIRQPHGSYLNYTLGENGKYKLVRTPDNRVINSFE